LLNWIINYTALSFESLPSTIISFVGIAAFKYGLKRFGKPLKIKLWLVFVVLWLFGFLTPIFLGPAAFQYMPAFGLPIFVLGVLFWIASLIFGVIKRIK
jgi:hypothetical protein